jgi:hypothetical protein
MHQRIYKVRKTRIFMKIAKTREQWLQDAAKMARKELFEPNGYTTPPIQISVGFPLGTKKGVAKNKTIGQCFPDSWAADKMHHIFLTPELDEPIKTLGVLIHEMVHATVGNKEGHNKVFKKCALLVGLEGKMTATSESTGLVRTLDLWMKKLGPFPHGKINLVGKPKQKSRQILVYCHSNCTDLKVRLAQKWIDEDMTPLCPVCQNSMEPKDD